MRKKLREIMDKEEGFTLVELLAVIVILGIIVAIAIPAIGNVIGESRDKATEAEQELVVDAARLYVTTNLEGQVDNNQKISVYTLIDKGYLEELKEDSTLKSTETGGDYVLIKKEDGKINYKFNGEAAKP